MHISDEDFERFRNGLLAGDPDVADDFFRKVVPALVAFTSSSQATWLRNRVPPEDLVQSACKSFWHRAWDGQFQLIDAARVWALLCAIALNKIRIAARKQNSGIAGLTREVDAQFSAAPDGGAGFEPTAGGLSPPAALEEAEFHRRLQESIGSLADEEQQILADRLQDKTYREIAAEMGKSESSVRRLSDGLVAKLRNQLKDYHDD